MLKTFRRSACLLFVLTLAAAIVVPTVADPIASVAGDGAQAGTSDDVLLAEDYELSEDLTAVGEPKANDLVSVIVKVDAPSLLEYANGKGIDVQDAMLRSEGVRVLNKIESVSESAKKALSPYLVSTGASYNTVLSGFAATVRYKDLSRLESDARVEQVILGDTYEAPQAITENEVNVDGSTGIFDSTDVGYDGTGTVIAVLDTGTDYTHEVFDMELDDTKTAITKDDVAALAPVLSATSISAAEEEDIDEDDLYLTTKLPYAYDYADGDTNVYPAEAHGTHVAGIIAGQSERIRGVAPGAQIATFKVFPDSGEGAPEEAILSALDDAVKLGVDAINMSLGTSCGFTREADGEAINDVYDSIEEAGICLVVAASNDYSSAYGSANGNTNLASNPDSGTVGSPASYSASLAVASIDGVKTPYFLLESGEEIYFRESRQVGKIDDNDFVGEMLAKLGKDEATLEYVVVPGVGYDANYNGIDVEGKIAVVRRGGNTFEQKVVIAENKGAIGVIIYNNVSGMLNMSVGTERHVPSCLISMDYGEILEERGSGKLTIARDYLAGPFMSDFSSWGVLPNLTLSPDITAHGGKITSSYPGGNEYDTISGTSMACPNLAGALILVRQYVKDMDATLTTQEVRDLSYSLMMSTATIANNEYGNPYSPRKQGAGLADIGKSVSTKAYLTVDGSNKPKLSLGDDPNRSGVYTLEFNITNLGGEALSYQLDPVVFTESMSSDDRTVAELAHLLDAQYSYSAVVEPGQGSAEMTSSGTLSLGGYSTAKITVTLTLTQDSKDYIDEFFKNGMYVEGYVRLNSLNADGIGLNLPYLAFYGDWADAPMLDVSAYEVGASQEDSSVLDEDKLVADVYATLPMAGFATTDDNGNDIVGSWGLGAYSYILPQGYSTPTTVERYASLTSSDSGNYILSTISAGLLRGAKNVDMQITDSVTGELIWQKSVQNGRKSSSSGGEQTGGYIPVEFDVRDYNLPNNGVYTFSMVCYLDWEDGRQGNRNTFSFDFTIDNEAPVLLGTYVREDKERNTKTLELDIYDNHYLQGYTIYTYERMEGNNPVGLTAITGGVVPVYDGKFNTTNRVSFDLTPYWSIIEQNDYKLYMQVMDYAKNTIVEYIDLGESLCDDLKIDYVRNAQTKDLKVDINGQLDLAQYVKVTANVGGTYAENYWSKPLVWESSKPDVVEVGSSKVSDNVNDHGVITGKSKGEATITVWPENDPENKLTFHVEVTGDTKVPGPSDVAVSLSDSAIVLERGESRTITLTPEPYNLEEIAPELFKSIKWTWDKSSENVDIAPSADGKSVTITARESGSATVSVRGEGTYAYASCSVSIQQEFQVDGVYLRSYTGRGDENGVVEIPDDLGVSYIYPQAFFDNDYITKIIIPEGVMYIMRAAIYGCDNLEEVVLPESLEQIQTFGMAWNPKLKTVEGLEYVNVIGSRAFIYDTSLEIRPGDLAGTTYIKDMAFYGCESITSLDLSKVGMIGDAAFAYCTGLKDLVIPENTTPGTAAFAYCTSLEDLTVYSENIGPGAFSGCTALDRVVFAGDVDTIGDEAFALCSALREVVFLGDVYRIGSSAFAECASLTSFTLPAGLEILGDQPFLGTNIREVTISRDARISQAGLAAFYGMPVTQYVVEEGSKYFSAQDGVLYDKAGYKLIAYPAGKIVEEGGTIRFPKGVRVIGENAFAGFSNTAADSSAVYSFTIDLTGIEIIEDYAFFGVGTLGFSGMQTSVQVIANVTVTGTQDLRVIGVGAFEQSYITSFVFHEGLREIGMNAFCATPVLKGDIVLPDSLTVLGDGAFTQNGTMAVSDQETGTLSYVSFRDYLRDSVGDGVTITNLSDFGGITSVTFGSGLKEAGATAFMNCHDLESADLGGITSVSSLLFSGCASLDNVVIPDTVREIGMGAFANCSALGTVTLPDNDGLTSIGEAAFMNTALTSVTLPESVTSIGASAFENVALTSVDLTHITSVGGRAFYGAKLAGALSSESVTAIGSEAFAGNTALTSVSFPKATEAGEGAFAGCTALTKAELPAVTKLGARAFEGDGVLSALTLTAVQTVGERAFAGTEALTALSLPALTSIGAEALYGSSVTSLALPATLSAVAERAFAGAEKLASLTVAAGDTPYFAEDGVLYRSTGSYDYATLVAYPEGKTDTSFTVRDRTIRIGAYAFANNPYLGSVTLPIHLRAIGAGAFYAVSNLGRIEFLSATAPSIESYSEPGYDEDLMQDIQVNIYDNFVWKLGIEDPVDLEVVVPSNATGYDLYIWETYLGKVGEGITLSDTAQPIQSAINFMDRVNALPAEITEADREEINVLQRIYNMLVPVQKNFVAAEYEKLREAASKLPPEQTGDPVVDPNEPTEQPAGGSADLGLIIGLSVAGGLLVLAGASALVIYFVRKRRGE